MFAASYVRPQATFLLQPHSFRLQMIKSIYPGHLFKPASVWFYCNADIEDCTNHVYMYTVSSLRSNFLHMYRAVMFILSRQCYYIIVTSSCRWGSRQWARPSSRFLTEWTKSCTDFRPLRHRWCEHPLTTIMASMSTPWEPTQ